MVLSILVGGRTYGYQLQTSLRDASRNLVQISAGTLYPLLHRLEADELIRSEWDESTGRRRKWYELTRAGRQRLASQARQWEAYVTCVRSLLDTVRHLLPKTV